LASRRENHGLVTIGVQGQAEPQIEQPAIRRSKAVKMDMLGYKTVSPASNK
jgi:hypothetical protein